MSFTLAYMEIGYASAWTNCVLFKKLTCLTACAKTFCCCYEMDLSIVMDLQLWTLFFLSRSDGMTQWLLLKERKLTSCLSTISSTTLPFSWFSSWHFSISCRPSASPFSFKGFLSFNQGQCFEIDAKRGVILI